LLQKTKASSGQSKPIQIFTFFSERSCNFHSSCSDQSKQAKDNLFPTAHGEVDIHPAAHGDPHAELGGHAPKKDAACGEPTQEQAPRRSCSLWRGVHIGAGFLAGPMGREGPTLEKCIPEEQHLEERTMLEQFMKNCGPWEGHTSEKFRKCLLQRLHLFLLNILTITDKYIDNYYR